MFAFIVVELVIGLESASFSQAVMRTELCSALLLLLYVVVVVVVALAVGHDRRRNEGPICYEEPRAVKRSLFDA